MYSAILISICRHWPGRMADAPGPDTDYAKARATVLDCSRVGSERVRRQWRDGQLYLDAHHPLSQEAERWDKRLAALEQVLAVTAARANVAIDWSRARKVAAESHGIPVVISVGGPDLGGVLAEAPRVPSEPYWAAADYADL